MRTQAKVVHAAFARVAEQRGQQQPQRLTDDELVASLDVDQMTSVGDEAFKALSSYLEEFQISEVAAGAT